jgi:hypothetical protein
MPKGMIWAELGVFKGEFSDIILKQADPKVIHLVDTWEGRWVNGGKDGDYDEWIDDMSLMYHKLKEKYSSDERVVLWRNKTEDFFDKVRIVLPIKALDAVYIDALHTYEDVKRDLNDAYAVTKRYILGHDYNIDRFPGCVKAVDEFCRHNDLKITHLTEDGCPTYLIPLQ